MQQTWKDLLFLHYKIPHDVLRKIVPKELELDVYNGETWIGVTPFKMRDMRFRLLPPIPTASNFLELNLRTYVKLNGRGGIYFFSLDTSSNLSAFGARFGAFLPYYTAKMSVEQDGAEFHFTSIRNSNRTAGLVARYRPVSAVFESEKGSLEEWFVERYCLFQETTAGRYIEIDIHHVKWQLQNAEVIELKNTLTKPLGFELPDEPPLAHFSSYQKVLLWPPRIVIAEDAADKAIGI